MTAYRLTGQADRDLGEIYLYAAEQFGIGQADRYADELEHVFGLPADHPLMGRSADRIKIGLRRHEHAGHVTFCRPIGGGVLIVAIIQRRMRPDLDVEEWSDAHPTPCLWPAEIVTGTGVPSSL